MNLLERSRPLEIEEIKHIIALGYADEYPVANITDRDASHYRQSLALGEVPIKSNSQIIDVGSGHSEISYKDFGLSSPNGLTRMDLFYEDGDTTESRLVKGNQLTASDNIKERYDEVWSMFSTQYVDFPVWFPEKLLQQTKDNDYVFARLFTAMTILELLNLTKDSGVVRVVSYAHHLVDPEANVLKTILSFVSQEYAEMVGDFFYKGLESHDGLMEDVCLIFKKGKDFDKNKILKEILQEFNRNYKRPG